MQEMHRTLHRTLITATALLGLSGILTLMGQPNPLVLPAIDLINDTANHLYFEGDRSAWDRYHGKLDKLLLEGTGQVNIVHVGSSHIQADMWSGQLRQRLQTTVPGVKGGRGFIFPYTIAKTNNPYWYHPQYTGSWSTVKNNQRGDTSDLGLAGYSVTTYDTSATIKVSFRGDVYPGYSFNRVKVLHAMEGSFAVRAWSPDSLVHVEWNTVADKGYTEFEYDRYVDTLYLRLERTDSTQSRFTLRGITLETNDPGFFYHATGVNGANTNQWLRCQLFSEELALLEPDLVVFSIGINDAHDPDFSADRYMRNYEQLIARVAEASPNAAILLTTNTDSYIRRRYPNKNGMAVRKVMLDLSRKYGCGVWDTYTVMGGQGSIAKWGRAGLAQADRIHFNRAGYIALGDLLFSAMMEAYGDHVRTTYRP
jgi:lysophospholipase L1-like esterase